MGSVVPLLAVAEELNKKNPNINFYWIGTKGGVEEEVVRSYNMEYRAIASGKFRRYFSLVNVLDIFRIILGWVQSIYILVKWRPQAIVATGGFVAVPVVWAGWMLGMPSLIHQQDMRVGLANKLCAGVAKKITVCFEESAGYFNPKKTLVVGNPIREKLKEGVAKGKELKKDLPLLLIMGGGRGANSINELVAGALNELVKIARVVHITGRNKNLVGKQLSNYRQYDFVADITGMLEAAEVVVSRAGMGSLTEIAYLKKPSIIIPIPGSHQEENALYFAERGGIAMLDQRELDEEKLAGAVRDILSNKQKMKEMGDRAHRLIKWGAEEKMAELIVKVAGRQYD